MSVSPPWRKGAGRPLGRRSQPRQQQLAERTREFPGLHILPPGPAWCRIAPSRATSGEPRERQEHHGKDRPCPLPKRVGWLTDWGGSARRATPNVMSRPIAIPLRSWRPAARPASF